MEWLTQHIKQVCSPGEGDIRILTQHIKERYFPAGSSVIKENQIDGSIYIIRRGVWRAYKSADAGEITLWFSTPGEAVISSWGYHNGSPCRLTVAASSNSHAYEITRTLQEIIFAESPDLSRWLHHLLTGIIMTCDDVVYDISDQSAEKRYLAFMKKMPVIFQEVPLKDIAAFIGVTPQSLSRIRAEIRKRK